jgi:hypothetical protein
VSIGIVTAVLASAAVLSSLSSLGVPALVLVLSSEDDFETGVA